MKASEKILLNSEKYCFSNATTFTLPKIHIEYLLLCILFAFEIFLKITL